MWMSLSLLAEGLNRIKRLTCHLQNFHMMAFKLRHWLLYSFHWNSNMPLAFWDYRLLNRMIPSIFLVFQPPGFISGSHCHSVRSIVYQLHIWKCISFNTYLRHFPLSLCVSHWIYFYEEQVCGYLEVWTLLIIFWIIYSSLISFVTQKYNLLYFLFNLLCRLCLSLKDLKCSSTISC